MQGCRSLTPGKGAKNLAAVPHRRNGCGDQPAMEVVVYPDPALRLGGKTVTAFDADLRELAARMLTAMYEEGGVGLAAPQVAIPQRLLVLNPKGDAADRSGELVLVNPTLSRKKGREFGEEGCLSFPGIYAEVERWIDITIAYQDLDGKPATMTASGWLARIIQHEMDHLDGVLFVDRLTPADRLRVRSKLDELEQRHAGR
jgi:peptide deformylase